MLVISVSMFQDWSEGYVWRSTISQKIQTMITTARNTSYVRINRGAYLFLFLSLSGNVSPLFSVTKGNRSLNTGEVSEVVMWTVPSWVWVGGGQRLGPSKGRGWVRSLIWWFPETLLYFKREADVSRYQGSSESHTLQKECIWSLMPRSPKQCRTRIRNSQDPQFFLSPRFLSRFSLSHSDEYQGLHQSRLCALHKE